MTDINSLDYWNKRFLEDLENLGGSLKSRFFAALAVELMPHWFVSRIRSAHFSLCDWGCAGGEGAAFLAEALNVTVDGIDFSAAAIKKAQEKIPNLKFRKSDLMLNNEGWKYDVVFSSNTLEHFHNPWEVFDKLASHANRYIVLLLPYRERDRPPEHFAGFEPGGLPLSRSGLSLVHAATVDVRSRPKTMWPGEQLLVIYARPEEIEACGLSLADMRIDSPIWEQLASKAVAEKLRFTQMEANLRFEVRRFRNELRHASQQTADVQARYAQLESRWIELKAAFRSSDDSIAISQRQGPEASVEVSHYRDVLAVLQRESEAFRQLVHSRSWRYTRPLRALIRLLTGRFGAGDRERFRSTFKLSSEVVSVPESHPQVVPDSSQMQSNGQEEMTLPSCLLADPRPGKEDVFVWAVIDWNFRTQRPQHLARALADSGHRVFYISNNLVDSGRRGFSVEPLNEAGTLFQVHLNLAGAPSIYVSQPSSTQLAQLRESLGTLLVWSSTRKSMAVVQHPYWLELAQSLPNSRSVYDCMDNHVGFENNADSVLEAERKLVVQADLVIVSSEWLRQEVADRNPNVALIRNATDFQHFCDPPAQVFVDEKGRRVIGYYGAIAEWFDAELIRRVAVDHPDCLVLLVGTDSAGVANGLSNLPNVRFIGEVPYADLPFWLYAFDVCLLPFRVIPLTLATIPVKIYEYLSAGKPVVAVDLPEMSQFGSLITTASDADAFTAAVSDFLHAGDSSSLQIGRRQFAEQQTWSHRAHALERAIEAIREPKVSIIVLTYNNLVFTEACLFSIEAYSDYPNLEVIVVDNASTDGSREWLSDWMDAPSLSGEKRRLILNEQNVGFAAGNNVGLGAATGDILILLNNDTYVTPGWIRTLCGYLRRRDGLGLIGPVTSNIGNEARIDIQYTDMHDMVEKALQYTRIHPGETISLRTAAFFCVAMRRSVYELIGGLDEVYGLGFFEDDDYCRRVAKAGFAIECAEDVFVHHHHSASFDAIKIEKRQELFARNRAVYESKWGPWVPHVYRSVEKK